MKIVVVSDTHRDLDVLDAIVQKNQADMYLHAGDSGMPSQLIKPFVSVRGNCDLFAYETSKVVQLGALRLFITHGHLFSTTRMLRHAKLHGCQVAIYGHTHIPKIELVDGIFLINPGSAVYPRQNNQKTYIVITFSSLEDIDIQIVEVS